jgi:hypothetical protein
MLVRAAKHPRLLAPHLQHTLAPQTPEASSLWSIFRILAHQKSLAPGPHARAPQTPERMTGMMDFMTISVCTCKRETKKLGKLLGEQLPRLSERGRGRGGGRKGGAGAQRRHWREVAAAPCGEAASKT